MTLCMQFLYGVLWQKTALFGNRAYRAGRKYYFVAQSMRGSTVVQDGATYDQRAACIITHVALIYNEFHC